MGNEKRPYSFFSSCWEPLFQSPLFQVFRRNAKRYFSIILFVCHSKKVPFAFLYSHNRSSGMCREKKEKKKIASRKPLLTLQRDKGRVRFLIMTFFQLCSKNYHSFSFPLPSLLLVIVQLLFFSQPSKSNILLLMKLHKNEMQMKEEVTFICDTIFL